MQIPYNKTEQLVHKMAFATGYLQAFMQDIESTFFAKPLSQIDIEKPVFITSLPRAGTSVLLNALYLTDEFTSYTYRQMPFIAAPLLWNKLSSPFQQKIAYKERAHNDGLKVNADSPEAFDEYFWLEHFPEKYHRQHIDLWTNNDSADTFNNRLKENIRKLLLLNRNDKRRRYISKNNANIGRIYLLKSIFPDATFLMPFRSPIQQAKSLLNQHLKFLKSHDESPFSCTYMASIGHFEFGKLHKRMRFSNTENTLDSMSFQIDDINYWLAYWCDAFDYILKLNDIYLLNFDTLYLAKTEHLQELMKICDIQTKQETMERWKQLFFKPSQHQVDYSLVDPDIEQRSKRIYEQLLLRSKF